MADTELDALNDILAGTGELPVNSLDSGLPDADMALRKLRQATRTAQGRGWYFNRERAYTATPDADGHITLNDVLEVQHADPFYPRHLVLRGTRLYDIDAGTDVFHGTVKLDVIWELPWEQLPMVFKEYVTQHAGRRHQDDSRSSQVLHKFQEADEQQAWMALMRSHTRSVRSNSNTGSYSVAKIVSRRVNPRPL